MPIHLRAEPSDYAPAVLVPGDPRRATYIAETFFDPGARCVNDERGMLGYTGTFKGKPISVQSVGMGCASAAIYYSELIQTRRHADHPSRHGRRSRRRAAHGRHRRGDQRDGRRPDRRPSSPTASRTRRRRRGR